MNPAQLLGKRCNEWQYQTDCWVLTFAGLGPVGQLLVKKNHYYYRRIHWKWHSKYQPVPRAEAPQFFL
jgi:hypothetical protein